MVWVGRVEDGDFFILFLFGWLLLGVVVFFCLCAPRKFELLRRLAWR